MVMLSAEGFRLLSRSLSFHSLALFFSLLAFIHVAPPWIGVFSGRRYLPSSSVAPQFFISFRWILPPSLWLLFDVCEQNGACSRLWRWLLLLAATMAHHGPSSSALWKRILQFFTRILGQCMKAAVLFRKFVIVPCYGFANRGLQQTIFFVWAWCSFKHVEYVFYTQRSHSILVSLGYWWTGEGWFLL